MTSVDLPPVATELDPDRYLANAYANDRQYVFHSWSAQGAITPTVIAGASGSRMWDDQGNTYLDFSCQLVNTNIGHQHPKMVAAIQQQAGRLCTIAPSMANDMRSEAARLIVERAPGDLEMVFFTNGGAEAVENAIRMAKLHTGRQKVLSMYRSYHGATAGAISVTGEARRHDSEPGMPGAVKFFGPYLYRSAFHATTEQEECERALAHLRNVVLGEGADRVAAIIVESVPGTNGILVPPPATSPACAPCATSSGS
jgi:taurine---2-oxoglutarate transaminase